MLGFRDILGMASLASLVAACSSAPPVHHPAGEGGDDQEPALEPAPTAFAMESELGSMDRGAVQEVFREATSAIDQCVAQGRARVPLIGGAIEVVVRVAADGQARWAYLLDSDLGDHRTESCILDVLRQRTWPKPAGGEEGEVTQQLDMGESEERPPVPWTVDDLGARFRTMASSLHRCRRQADTGPLGVTFYVDPNGRALAAGVAVADEKGQEAVDCVVRTVQRGRFPSPGSYPAKVSVRID